MSLLVSVKAYDGSIVRIPKEKLKDFNLQQSKIQNLIKNGVSLQEIQILLRENKL